MVNNEKLMELYTQYELFTDDENVEFPPVIEELPEIPSALYCVCKSPELVRSEANREVSLYCRECKKEWLDKKR